jgi:autotransporter-associated beta strand protein
LSGVVSGAASAGLVKEGDGTLFLTKGYTYSGPTLVSAGKLELGLSSGVNLEQSRQITLGAGAQLSFVGLTADLKLPNTEILGASDAVTSANPAFNVEWKGGSTVKRLAQNETLDLSSLKSGTKIDMLNGGTLKLSSGGDLTLSNNIAIGKALDVEIGANEVLTVKGVVSDGSVNGVAVVGSVVKVNAGKMILNAANTYSGGTEVRGGTLEVQNAQGAGGGRVSVGTGAVLTLNAAPGVDLSFANPVEGAGALLKSGSGTVVLTGTSNSFGGGASIVGGTLEVRKNGALGTGAIAVGVDGALRVNPEADATVSMENKVDGAGFIVKDGAGTLALKSTGASGVNVPLVLHSGAVALAAGANVSVPVTVAGVIDLRTGDGGATLSGALSGTGTLNLTGVLNGGATVAGGASVGINGGILSSFEKRGAGELSLGSSALLSGGSTQVLDGTLKVSANETLARVTTLDVGTSAGSGARLDVSQIPGGLVVGGGTLAQVLKGSGSIKGVVKLAAGATIAPGNSPGTEKIEGSLQVLKGATYQVEYTVSSNASTLVSDLLQVVATSDVPVSGAVSVQGGIV